MSFKITNFFCSRWPRYAIQISDLCHFLDLTGLPIHANCPLTEEQLLLRSRMVSVVKNLNRGLLWQCASYMKGSKGLSIFPQEHETSNPSPLADKGPRKPRLPQSADCNGDTGKPA